MRGPGAAKEAVSAGWHGPCALIVTLASHLGLQTAGSWAPGDRGVAGLLLIKTENSMQYLFTIPLQSRLWHGTAIRSLKRLAAIPSASWRAALTLAVRIGWPAAGPTTVSPAYRMQGGAR
jgi:hypothetical protein